MSGLSQIFLLCTVVAVVFVNGWTDAPNAITGVVATGSLSYRSAVKLAAVCNLAGILIMSLLTASVADTITSMVRFDGANPAASLAALCSAMIAIVVFAVAAWWFGIPTSESHALIAALTGAGIALGGLSTVDFSAWSLVLVGLALSAGAGLLGGALFTRLLARPLRRCSGKALDRLQVVSAGGMAFLHGAQDGQKFLAVFVIVDLLAAGRYGTGSVEIRQHLPSLCLIAAVMALGTAVGGKRIIRSVGERMVPLQKHQGVCADLAGGLCLLLGSLWGVPMSTTHTKTCAIMGTGLAEDRSKVDFGVMRGMVFAWLITFPVCGMLGYLLTRVLV